ncbi:MAG: GWxTD domain-containing protein, partial [Gemmatimonadota bacterium]|nr:GWxTD domain-containing protein [Gemmatimonadota bacterium]
GDMQDARNDFTRALFSKSARIRSRAHIGLGDIYRRNMKNKWDAVDEYRLAAKIDPACCEAYYALAQTGLELQETTGYRTAAKALAQLICLDPEYRDAYSLWREKILDKTSDELRSTCLCIENFLADNPGKGHLWLDIAYDRFKLDEVESTLETLANLERDQPRHKPQERFLLRARCRLALGDTLEFEDNYGKALEAAQEEGDHSRLLIEAAPIFNSWEREIAEKLKGVTNCAQFLRAFWKRRDPDPISPANERMITHYTRLREVEKQYFQFNPNSLFNSSRIYHRLLSPKSSVYDYDPDLFFDRSRQLSLDPRGLLYLRHGQPDEVRSSLTGWGRNDPMELWVYDGVYFFFQQKRGAGDFVYYPANVDGVANIKQAMATESFNDPLPAVERECYWTYFKAPDGQLEVEFYQSAPVETVVHLTNPEATLAIYDSTWKELARDKSTSTEIKTPSDNLWIAANRVTFISGSYISVSRMEIPGYRAVQSDMMELELFADNRLDLSGVILGSPPQRGKQVHSRMGIDILPRPSLEFLTDEIITVYFEVYGLKQDINKNRAFVEWVTVSRIEEEKSKLGGLLSSINPFGKKQSAGSRLTFQRELPTGSTGPVAEQFTIDTSELIPGSYSMVIDVLDRNNNQVALTGCSFEQKKRK